MLSSIKQRIDRDEEEGFTLIELMVVLLIIAILLAIAIPTFLGARNTANARSTQENLRNALTAEQANYTSTQSFNNVLTSEPSLSFVTTSTGLSAGSNQVYTAVCATSVSGGNVGCSTNENTNNTNADGIVIIGLAKDNHCYGIFQSNNSTNDFTAYSEWSGTCSIPASIGTAPTAGSAANGVTTATSANAVWYASF